MRPSHPRVLQVMAGAARGGAEAFFERLAIALHRVGLPQRAVIRRNAARNELLRLAGLEVAELPFGGLLDLTTGRALRREIAGFRPDIVLTWMSRSTRFCPPGDFVHVARLGGYYDLKYYRHCDHLIGNTQAVVDYLLDQGWPRERAHHLPNFVDATVAAPVERAALDTPANVPLVLALGRLHRNKAFDVLLEALARMPDVHLWLAGDGPLKDDLARQATRLAVAPRVRFLGWRTDTAALFAAADLFVCPSRHEPLGNVVIEAWAQGVPVVAAASDGPRALIEPEETGLLVPVDDAAALADAMGRALGQPELGARLAAAGRRAHAETYGEPVVVQGYIDFFQRVAERRAPPRRSIA